jgi:hypothetical protein
MLINVPPYPAFPWSLEEKTCVTAPGKDVLLFLPQDLIEDASVRCGVRLVRWRIQFNTAIAAWFSAIT